MSGRRVTTTLSLSLSLALTLSAVCDAAELPSDVRSEAAPQYGSETAVRDVADPARDATEKTMPRKDNKKRGNTPPGTDRSGGGPASGAILDPAGAVTKEPVLRER